MQALYDSGASRRKGNMGIDKLVKMLKKYLHVDRHLSNLREIKANKMGYFLPDKTDTELFKIFKANYKVKYEFGKTKQTKNPDLVLKALSHFFIIEAKHIKEAGGAQDKQIDETISFIKYSEPNTHSISIHYLAFVDGTYFNKFIAPPEKQSKVIQQIKDIVLNLEVNPANFFVNTAGIRRLLKDIRKAITPR